MDILRRWVEHHSDEPVIVPRRQERFLGVQPPGIVESDSLASNFAEGNDNFNSMEKLLTTSGPINAGMVGAMKNSKDPAGGFTKGAGGWVKGAAPAAEKGAAEGGRAGPEGAIVGAAGRGMLGGGESARKEITTQEQSTLDRFTPKKPSVADVNSERKKNADALRRWISGRMVSQDVSGDAPDINASPWPEGKQILSNDGVKKQDVLENFVKARMKQKESKEHPTLSNEAVEQIVEDHFRGELK